MSIHLPPTGQVANVLLKFENERPSEADFATIGKIALFHNALQYQLEGLVWVYFGDYDLGHVATSRLGANELTDKLLTLVEWTEHEDHVAEAIEWVVKCFHVLRIKRNAVVHAFNFKAHKPSRKLYLERRTKSLVGGDFEEFELSPDILQSIRSEQVLISSFVYGIERMLKARGSAHIGHDAQKPDAPSPLPPRPLEPQILEPLPREIPRSARHQRRASPALEARQQKADRKAAQRADAKQRLAKD